MDTVPHWEDQKLSGSDKGGSEKGDTSSVEVTELEKSQTTSSEQQEYLVADYARDVAVKVRAAMLSCIYLQLIVSGRFYLRKMTRRNLP